MKTEAFRKRASIDRSGQQVKAGRNKRIGVAMKGQGIDWTSSSVRKDSPYICLSQAITVVIAMLDILNTLVTVVEGLMEE